MPSGDAPGLIGVLITTNLGIPSFVHNVYGKYSMGDCSYTESARHARTVILSPRRRISWLSVRSVVPEYDFDRVPVELVIASESNERSLMCKSGAHFALLGRIRMTEGRDLRNAALMIKTS